MPFPLRSLYAMSWKLPARLGENVVDDPKDDERAGTPVPTVSAGFLWITHRKLAAEFAGCTLIAFTVMVPEFIRTGIRTPAGATNPTPVFVVEKTPAAGATPVSTFLVDSKDASNESTVSATGVGLSEAACTPPRALLGTPGTAPVEKSVPL